MLCRARCSAPTPRVIDASQSSTTTIPFDRRAEFRLNRNETDPTKLKQMLNEATVGLASMRTQIGWQTSSEIGNTSGVLAGVKPAAGE